MRISPRLMHKVLPKKMLLFIGIIVLSSPVHTHEYWLDPVGTQWQVGEELSADIRNGENFIGTAYPFDDNAIRSDGLVSDTARRPLRGRLGDYPAVRFTLEEPGLHLLIVETTPRQITYPTGDKFHTFLKDHALESVVDPLETISSNAVSINERYWRYVKSIVAVEKQLPEHSNSTLFSTLADNAKAPAIEPQGQRFELLISPIDTDDNQVELALLFDGQPLAQRQIEIFHRNDEHQPASRTIVISDNSGKALIDVSRRGNYLLNSVWITRPNINDVDWETFWTSLTFSH